MVRIASYSIVGFYGAIYGIDTDTFGFYLTSLLGLIQPINILLTQ